MLVCRGSSGLTRGLREVDSWFEGSRHSRELGNAMPSTAGLFIAVFKCPANALPPELETIPDGRFVVWGKWTRGLGEVDSWFGGNQHVVWGKSLVV
jgi:hypothetical protein